MPYCQPKPQRGTALKAKRTRTRQRLTVDARESDKVRARSGGRCEVVTFWPSFLHRCLRRATQVHHLIGGIGKRGRGISALAEHKQHVCDQCHLWITGDLGGRKLQRVGDVVPHWTDCYERVSAHRGDA